MAAPTVTETFHPNYVFKVTGTDIDAGDFDRTLEFTHVNTKLGFSVITGTLTNITVKLFASNDDANLIDVTSDLAGVANLASSTAYLIDISVPVKTITVRVTRTSATNSVNLTVFSCKR